MPILTLEIEQTTHHLLNELCVNLKLSPKEVVTKALKAYQNEQIIEQRLRQLDEGSQKVITEAAALEMMKAQQ
ncbi:MAG: hypothetical protein A2329_05095 [Sulfurimonas sp. RIFOXYB2_FULL_37_5]|nr:MAG: hypothetical protein A2329_05095 [Sulfurimonas sp. RIFOXYB2_FULL_37_5]